MANQAVRRTVQLTLDAKQFEAGIRKLDKSLGGLQRSAQATTKAVKSMQTDFRSLVGVLATFQGAKHLIEYASELQNVRNMVRTVSDSEEGLVGTEKALLESANRSRVAYSAQAKLYARVARNTKDLGLNQDQLVTISERVSKALIVNGSSAQEAFGAVIQLSQAFASGKLQGEEFRSVAENAPQVLDVLAKSLGVARGQLKQMAADGKITSAALADALLNYGDQIEQSFGKTTPTIGQSLTILKNNFDAMVRSLEDSTGILQGTAELFKLLADNLNLVLGVLTTGGLLVAVTAVKTLGAAVAALVVNTGPVGWALAGIAVAAGALVTALLPLIEQTGSVSEAFKVLLYKVLASSLNIFAAMIRSIGSLVSALEAMARAVTNVVISLLQKVLTPFTASIRLILQAAQKLGAPVEDALGLLDKIETFQIKPDAVNRLDGMATGFEDLAKSAMEAAGGILLAHREADKPWGKSGSSPYSPNGGGTGPSAKEQAKQLKQLMQFISTNQSAADKLQEEIDKATAYLNNPAYAKFTQKLQAIIANDYAEKFRVENPDLVKYYEDVVNNISELKTNYSGAADGAALLYSEASKLYTTGNLKGLEDFAKSTDKLKDTYTGVTDRIKELRNEYVVTADTSKYLQDRLDALLSAGDAEGIKNFKKEFELLSPVLYSQAAVIEKVNAQLIALGKLYDAGKISADDFNYSAVKAAEAIQQNNDDVKDSFKELKSAIEGFGKDAAKAIVDFTITGKSSFSDMVTSMLADIAQLLIYKNVTQPAANALESIDWGSIIASFFGGGRASGGAVSAGKMYQVNERGPELLYSGGRTYLMAGQNGYVSPVGGSSTGSPTVNITLLNQTGQQVDGSAKASSGPNGLDLEITLYNRITSRMSRDIAKGGGPISTVLENRYGLNPAAGAKR